MSEVENQMKLPSESILTETEVKLLAVDDVFKKEPSILDEILTDESAESTLKTEGDTNIGQPQPKEVMVSHVHIPLIALIDQV